MPNTKTKSYDVLSSPLSKADQQKLVESANGRVDEVVQISLNTMIGEDLNEVLNALSRKTVGHTLLREVDYEVVGVSDDGVTFDMRVTGYLPKEA
jgi:hypothetical protein